MQLTDAAVRQANRRVSVVGLALVCWKHIVARQLAIHDFRHHAGQQELDGDARK